MSMEKHYFVTSDGAGHFIVKAGHESAVFTTQAEAISFALKNAVKIDIKLEDGRAYELREIGDRMKSKQSAEDRAAMFDSWKGQAELIEGWDSPETNSEIWQEFWNNVEDDSALPNPSPQTR